MFCFCKLTIFTPTLFSAALSTRTPLVAALFPFASVSKHVFISARGVNVATGFWGSGTLSPKLLKTIAVVAPEALDTDTLMLFLFQAWGVVES